MSKEKKIPEGWRRGPTVWPIGRGLPTFKFVHLETGHKVRYRGLYIARNKHVALETLLKDIEAGRFSDLGIEEVLEDD